MNRNEADVTTATAPTQAVLTAGDRCDRCGAQAYVKAVLPGGGELLFCGHHGRQFAPTLEAQGADVVDETVRLTEDATAG